MLQELEQAQDLEAQCQGDVISEKKRPVLGAFLLLQPLLGESMLLAGRSLGLCTSTAS